MVCTSDLVLNTALLQVDCAQEEDPVVCNQRVGPALETSTFFSDVCSITAQDIIRQYREGERCPAGTACQTDADCDDGRFCNGAETCEAGLCTAGQDPCAAEQVCQDSGQVCSDQAPVADAGSDQAVFPNTVVTLDGSGSADPSGAPLSYSWVQISGTAVSLNGANSAMATFTAPSQGTTLVFELTVDDGNDGSSADRVTITLLPNQAPVADAGSDQAVAGAEEVMLDGSGSVDPDGDELTYMWFQTAGTLVNLTGADSATPSFAAPYTNETLSFDLILGDGKGGQDTDTVDIIVQSAPWLFVANTGSDSVVGFMNPENADGQTAPNIIVVSKDSTGYVSDGVSNTIYVFDNIGSLSGADNPDRTISRVATNLNEPYHMFLLEP